jgi:hypothetical protein
MKQVNRLKKDDDAVLLLDGFEIVTQEEVSLMSSPAFTWTLDVCEIRSHRTQWLLTSSGISDFGIARLDPQAMKNLVEGFKSPCLQRAALPWKTKQRGSSSNLPTNLALFFSRSKLCPTKQHVRI